MYHEFDSDFITEGGNLRLYALQLRFALNDRLALIATKDGYIDFNPNAVLDDESGFANIALGTKYAFWKSNSAIVSSGLRYEIPSGNRDVFQGEGDGHINPFVSAGSNFDDFNFIAGTGFRLAIDNDDSTFYDLDLHFDKQIGSFYPSLEFNLVHVIEAGNRLGLPDEGADLVSFGSSLSEGKTLVTAALGLRYRINDAVDIGAAYQVPVTSGVGSNIFDWRVTTDLIFSFDI
jgi:hypothetical protein